jgi:hypothetical protein
MECNGAVDPVKLSDLQHFCSYSCCDLLAYLALFMRRGTCMISNTGFRMYHVGLVPADVPRAV